MLQDLVIEWSELFVPLSVEEVSRNIELKPGFLLRANDGEVILVGHITTDGLTIGCCAMEETVITAVSQSLRNKLIAEGVLHE